MPIYRQPFAFLCLASIAIRLPVAKTERERRWLMQWRARPALATSDQRNPPQLRSKIKFSSFVKFTGTRIAQQHLAFFAPRTRTDFSNSRRSGIGNPGGSPEATRRAFNKRFLLDLAEDWQQHGREVFKRVRRESPAAYLKVCAMLVPKEAKLEHSTSAIKAMTDEQIEQAIELIQTMRAARADETANGIG